MVAQGGFPATLPGNHISARAQEYLGDPHFCVCQAPNAFMCVSPCGSILGPFWVHSGSILGSIFGVHFLGPFLGSIFGVHFWGPFLGSILGSIFGVHFWGPSWVHLGSIV